MGHSWDYGDADTQRLTHNIHRYSGKFIPQIAARAIELLTRPRELVLDPYCGSGTTLLEAALQGRRAIGIDLNPLAVLIARTKVTPVPGDSLASLCGTLRRRLAAAKWADTPLFQGVRTGSGNWQDTGSDPRLNDDWYRKWFQPDVLRELLLIDDAICEVQEESLRSIARVAFSDILRKSSNAHSGYPNVMFDKNAGPRPSPIAPFLRTLERTCAMVHTLDRIPIRPEDVHVQQANASALPLEDNSIDAVISHPPYIGSIPYAEYGLLSLKWLGANPRELDAQLTGGRRHSASVVSRFARDYSRMMHETARVLRPGRCAFLMVGNPVVRGKAVDLASMTISLAADAGLELVAQAARNGLNRRANKMGQEHLLFFRKAPILRTSEDRTATRG
jgi:SAM-dependent methyltransferase